MQWQVLFLDKRVRAELEAQPKDIQARFLRIAELIAGHGLERVHEPYIKHLEGPLWEMRMKGRDGVARAVYVTASGKRQAAGASSWCACSARKRKRRPGAKLIWRLPGRRRRNENQTDSGENRRQAMAEGSRVSRRI